MNRTLLLILLLLWGTVSLAVTGSDYSFTQFSIGQGLSQATVQSVLLDHKGTLWIGTKSGLNAYTQHSLKTFTHSEDEESSLPNNYIYHIAEDSLGTIWVSTRKGLHTYDEDSEGFLLASPTLFYTSLCIDGGILFGGDNVIYRYDYPSRRFLRIVLQPSAPDGTAGEYRVQSLTSMDNRRVLVGTRERGLFVFDLCTRQLTPFTADSHHILLSVCLASDGYVYLASHGNGLYRYDRRGKLTAHYTRANSALSSDHILDMAEDEGCLWLATDGGGINLLNLEDKQFTHIRHTAGDKSSLPVNSITLLYKDHEDNLWAGSVRGGLFGIRRTYIKTYKDVALDNPNGLSEKSVISLCEEADGRLWIGTDGGGINLYDPHTDRFTHFPSTYGDKVVSIAEMSERELMVSLYTKGIFLFDKQTAAYRPFTIVNDSVNFRECFYGYLPFAHQVGKDKMYLLGHSAWIYHPRTHTFRRMKKNTGQHITTQALVLAYSDSRQSLLMRNNHVFTVAQHNDSISRLFSLDAETAISSLCYDGQHTIWTGSTKGLGYYDLSERKFHTVPTKLFSSVSSLHYDGKGKLWVCAQNMLFSYLIDEGRFVVWNSSDGFPPNEIMFSYQKMPANDHLYLCGTDGLVKINTSLPLPDFRQPEILLDDIRLNGISCKQQLKGHSISIPWNYHTLSLYIRIKDKDIFQKNLLHYHIQGDMDRRIETYDPRLSLPGLPAGDYTIRVSCSTKDGNFTDPIRLIHLSVLPPWYRSTWFYLAAFALSAALAIGLARYAYRQKEKRSHHSKEADTVATPRQETTASKGDDEFLTKLNRLINENLSADKLSIKFLTEEMAMSRASLYNKVKIVTGMGVNDYINRLRIERSVYLLTHTDLNINEISDEVGFTYPRYFSTCFKQVKGMTPTQFKEEYKKKK